MTSTALNQLHSLNFRLNSPKRIVAELPMQLLIGVLAIKLLFAEGKPVGFQIIEDERIGLVDLPDLLGVVLRTVPVISSGLIRVMDFYQRAVAFLDFLERGPLVEAEDLQRGLQFWISHGCIILFLLGPRQSRLGHDLQALVRPRLAPAVGSVARREP